MAGNEQRLWLVVLLDSLASLHEPDRSTWIKSRDFQNISRWSGVRPQVAAQLTARRAKLALRILRSHQNLDKILDQLEGEDDES